MHILKEASLPWQDHLPNMKSQSENIQSLPIGVFDSGVGGLTVLRALQQELPQESFLYLGDTARLPYGTKSADTIQRYAISAAQLLVTSGIKLLVVACNTATTLALSSLQAHFPHLPIVGVVEPGAETACRVSKTGNIAVIATEATVAARGYHNAILKIRPDAHVKASACSLFVALAEEGWTEGEIVTAVARRYLEPLLFKDETPDCLILGCTHFPVLGSTIKSIAGSKIQVVDSAHTTALKVAQLLSELKLNHANTNPRCTFLVTDSPARFVRFARTFLGHAIDDQMVELVEINLC